ncbi:hypothetical protein [Geothrix limicola]|uniref:hypothetical protein n=1 Tax=Geothrix limicola TaxID=2927978 RepID=UPI0025574CD5|nr:hypothetical protein [Geothrix limicola]
MPYTQMLFTAITVLSIAGSQEPPSTAPSHTKQNCRLIKAEVLVPKGWELLEEDKGSLVLVSITKNGKPAEFQNVGVGILMMKNAPVKLGVPISQYIKKVKDQVAGAGKVLSLNEMNKGPFRCLRAEFIGPREDGKLLHILSLTIGNEKTGTMFSAVATSFDSDWKNDREQMEPILQAFEPSEAE